MARATSSQFSSAAEANFYIFIALEKISAAEDLVRVSLFDR